MSSQTTVTQQRPIKFPSPRSGHTPLRSAVFALWQAWLSRPCLLGVCEPGSGSLRTTSKGRPTLGGSSGAWPRDPAGMHVMGALDSDTASRRKIAVPWHVLLLSRSPSRQIPPIHQSAPFWCVSAVDAQSGPVARSAGLLSEITQKTVIFQLYRRFSGRELLAAVCLLEQRCAATVLGVKKLLRNGHRAACMKVEHLLGERS